MQVVALPAAVLIGAALLAPASHAPPGASPMIGINVGNSASWSFERSAANLVLPNRWFQASKSPWVELTEDRVASDGSIKDFLAGETLVLPVAMPASGPEVRIRCTWEGRGTMVPRQAPGAVVRSNFAEFNVKPQQPLGDGVWLELSAQDNADPVRAVDCREKSMPADKLFADEFIESLRPFKVVRFLDWQNSNANLPVIWATRTLPTSFQRRVGDGVAIEHMIALAKDAGVDPWFIMPWNTDDDYLRRFAQLVHDTLPRDRKVYLETGNEVWNYGFKVTHQAIAEGEARGLNKGGWGAGLERYAQRSIETFKIWERVFADRPGQLVRVVSAQHGNPLSAEIIMAVPGIADHADALATAPYFGPDLFEVAPQGASEDQLLDVLESLASKEVAFTDKNTAIARQYGKRHITYEAGQHVVLASDVPLLAKLQRNPRMEAIYRSYIAGWRKHNPDLMVLYNSTNPVAWSGAWGLREYAGHPLSETPKRRAVLEAAQQR